MAVFPQPHLLLSFVTDGDGRPFQYGCHGCNIIRLGKPDPTPTTKKHHIDIPFVELVERASHSRATTTIPSGNINSDIVSHQIFCSKYPAWLPRNTVQSARKDALRCSHSPNNRFRQKCPSNISQRAGYLYDDTLVPQKGVTFMHVSISLMHLKLLSYLILRVVGAVGKKRVGRRCRRGRRCVGGGALNLPLWNRRIGLV